MAEQILIFDIDGTLAGISERRERILLNAGMKLRPGMSVPYQLSCLSELDRQTLEEFMNPKLLIEEPILDRVIEFMQTDQRPRWFLTSRWERLRQVTVEWLVKVGWPAARGFMRADKDTDQPAVRVKCEHLIARFARTPHDVLLVDDDPIMIRAAHALGFDAVFADVFFGRR